MKWHLLFVKKCGIYQAKISKTQQVFETNTLQLRLNAIKAAICLYISICMQIYQLYETICRAEERGGRNETWLGAVNIVYPK